MFHVKLDQTQFEQMTKYLNHWFCPQDELAYRCGEKLEYVEELIGVGAIAGDAYRTEGSKVWSALGAYLEHPEPVLSSGKINQWYSNAVIPWIRRARLSSTTDPALIADKFYHEFEASFINAIDSVDEDLKAYTESISDAEDAWNAWVKGAYAVCMRSFSANSIVDKLSRRLRAKEYLAAGVQYLSEKERATLLADVTRLSEILTPFSPFERINGTPGTVIDQALKELDLGSENPYAGCNAPPH